MIPCQYPGHDHVPAADSSDARRFWSRVNKGGPVVSPELGPCWLWTGAITGTGYGALFMNGKTLRAHRIAFALAEGRWPTANALHRCDNPLCVRPEHIFDGTQKDNAVDMARKRRGRGWVFEPRTKPTHCPRGHSMTPANTKVRKNGTRQCRACMRLRKTKAYLTAARLSGSTCSERP